MSSKNNDATATVSDADVERVAKVIEKYITIAHGEGEAFGRGRSKMSGESEHDAMSLGDTMVGGIIAPRPSVPPGNVGFNIADRRELAQEAARAAITAMPSSADDNWLDAALDSVKAELNWTEKRTVGYEAAIRILTGPDSANDEDYIEITGTGPTRRAAIEDAVAKAKGREG